jgi:hypothetical protein
VPDAVSPVPEHRPPRGVPRWLWPPPGAEVRRAVLREESTASGARHHVAAGEPPGRKHLRALQWLIGEYPRDDAPADRNGVTDIVLEIARTSMPAGRVGHAYALNGQALGAPGNRDARGVLWRYALSVLGPTAPDFDAWSEDDF